MKRKNAKCNPRNQHIHVCVCIYIDIYRELWGLAHSSSLYAYADAFLSFGGINDNHERYRRIFLRKRGAGGGGGEDYV